MRYLGTKELLTEEIILQNVFALPIREPQGAESVFRNKRRQCSVLFLYLAGEREYTVDNNESFRLVPGDILYVPQYASYRFRITKGDPCDYAIAINFTMSDAIGQGVCFGSKPRILIKDRLGHYQARFLKILEISGGAHLHGLLLKSAVYSLLYELLYELLGREAVILPWRDILPAIEQIEADAAADIPIPRLAQECGVSETRFRRLFRLYTGGISPVQYRNQLRMEKAIRMLRTEQVTVEQAARDAGFSDMSYFYRLLRRYKARREAPPSDS